MRHFIVILTILSLFSVSHAKVIGDFEGGSLDDFSGINDPTPVLVDSDTPGTVTRGERSLSITTNGDEYWYLQWDAPSIPAALTELTFDLSMIAAEWGEPQDKWTRFAEKIAINSDGPDGWTEYVSSEENWSWRDPNRTDPCPVDWGNYDPDAFKSYSMDISDYDLTGVTWLSISFSVAGGDGTGAFYIDNVQILDQAHTPTPVNWGIAYIPEADKLKWTNAVYNLSYIEVWFAEGASSDANYIDNLTKIYTETDPDPNSSAPMPTLGDDKWYTWYVDGYIYGPDADPNVYLGPVWTFYATNNADPIADAGPDQYKWLITPDANVLITLDGTGSTDDGPYGSLTFNWTQIAGQTVTIDTPTSDTSTVLLTGGLANTTEPDSSEPYQFQVEVSDGQFSDTDVVTVTVNSNSCRATAESGGSYFWGDIAGPEGGGDDYRDCKVNIYDFAEISLNWINCSNVFEACD